ncbi:hypothetical protein [Amycolatopsis sp. cmx-4-61]|uniref:hypothetical protein n=1 Tax=Amycolatopsis sp. cmx-4-61 TaxID=2790937 RepID=UPI003979B428
MAGWNEVQETVRRCLELLQSDVTAMDNMVRESRRVLSPDDQSSSLSDLLKPAGDSAEQDRVRVSEAASTCLRTAELLLSLEVYAVETGSRILRETVFKYPDEASLGERADTGKSVAYELRRKLTGEEFIQYYNYMDEQLRLLRDRDEMLRAAATVLAEWIRPFSQDSSRSSAAAAVQDTAYGLVQHLERINNREERSFAANFIGLLQVLQVANEIAAAWRQPAGSSGNAAAVQKALADNVRDKGRDRNALATKGAKYENEQSEDWRAGDQFAVTFYMPESMITANTITLGEILRDPQNKEKNAHIADINSRRFQVATSEMHKKNLAMNNSDADKAIEAVEKFYAENGAYLGAVFPTGKALDGEWGYVISQDGKLIVFKEGTVWFIRNRRGAEGPEIIATTEKGPEDDTFVAEIKAYQKKHPGYDYTAQVLHHTSPAGGEPVICAGSLNARQGVLLKVTNMSGHYTPVFLNLVNGIEVLANMGLPLDQTRAEIVGNELKIPVPEEKLPDVAELRNLRYKVGKVPLGKQSYPAAGVASGVQDLSVNATLRQSSKEIEARGALIAIRDGFKKQPGSLTDRDIYSKEKFFLFDTSEKVQQELLNALKSDPDLVAAFKPLTDHYREIMPEECFF